MKYRITILLALACLFHFTPASAQGCSDAGFCTMGAMKPDQPFYKNVPLKLRSMELSFYRGTTTLSPVVYVATLDMNFNIADDKTFLQVKLPYQSISGNFGKTSGMSDISLCVTRKIGGSATFEYSVSAGAKIPSNDANLKDDVHNIPLPMYYQTSLGTYDLIAGFSMISRDWLFATGIQHPFNQNNNQFRWSDWIPVYSGGADYVRDNHPAFELKRGTDIMLRVERNFRFSRINFSLGALPIYRIARDEIVNTETGERFKPEGTTGLALSVIGTAGYGFNVRSGVKLLYGKKIAQRDFNPDGLTRNSVVTASYYYRF